MFEDPELIDRIKGYATGLTRSSSETKERPLAILKHNFTENNDRNMFHTLENLKKRTGPDGIGRYDFLKQLIVEFNTTKSSEAKYQVLANLANFAYDPINFEFLKQLHCIDVFLAQLSENDEKLIEFALGGLCNIIVDPEAKAYILKLNGLNLISQFITQQNEDILIYTLTLNFYISKDVELPNQLIENIQKLANHSNSRIRNLVKIILNAQNE